MNWKIFIWELIRLAYPVILIITGIFAYAYLVIFHEIIAAVITLIPVIFILGSMLFDFWIEPAYTKAKQEKSKCHWKIRSLKTSTHYTIYDCSCGASVAKLSEKCEHCGKEVVIDL